MNEHAKPIVLRQLGWPLQPWPRCRNLRSSTMLHQGGGIGERHYRSTTRSERRAPLRIRGRAPRSPPRSRQPRARPEPRPWASASHETAHQYSTTTPMSTNATALGSTATFCTGAVRHALPASVAVPSRRRTAHLVSAGWGRSAAPRRRRRPARSARRCAPAMRRPIPRTSAAPRRRAV